MSGLENYKDLKILVTGGSGQIGSCLKQVKDDYKSIFYFPSSVVLNLKEQGSIKKYIDHNKINFVINLAAYTNVDKAETEKDESNLINNIAPTLIAKECKKREIPLIHFSTDYVFGGEGVGPFKPNDKKFPVNEYGRSKSLGEDNILKENSNSLIIRVASVFGHFGNNFIKTMTKLVLTKDEVNIVSDNQISMFYANDFSSNIIKILDLFHKHKPGLNILHLASYKNTNWFEVSKIIANQINIYDNRLSTAKLNPISSKDWISMAERPLDSRLEINNDLLRKYDIKISSWEESVREVVIKYLPKVINEIKNGK